MSLYSLSRVSTPSILPITLEDIKNFLRISYEEDNELLNDLCRAVTYKFENYTKIALMFQQWRVTYGSNSLNRLKLPIRPAREVLKLEVVDSKISRTIDPQYYDLEEDSVRVTIFPNYSRLRIIYLAGIAERSEHVPSDIKVSLLDHVAYLYDNRGTGMADKFSLQRYDEFRVFSIF